MPCACAYVALFAHRLAYNIMQLRTHTMQQTCTHKAVTRRVEAKTLLSRLRQLEYRDATSCQSATKTGENPENV